MIHMNCNDNTGQGLRLRAVNRYFFSFVKYCNTWFAPRRNISQKSKLRVYRACSTSLLRSFAERKDTENYSIPHSAMSDSSSSAQTPAHSSGMRLTFFQG